MPFEEMQLGRYRLQQQLGSGGMGEVYLAVDTHINRQVAVKIIRSGATAYPNEEATKESARLFQREMRAIAVLDHPNILPLYDYGEETVGRTTLTYMVMPYRKEGSLADWLQQRSKKGLLSLQEVSRLIQQAGSALQHAHNHKIIHQDVKPSNFLIHITDDEPDQPNLQLADFGVAKFTSATSSMSHAIRGTPTYMALEQWEGSPVPATDQYALAITAYELLTGRPPFQGGMGQLMYQHFNTQPQPPSSLNPAIPKDLDTVLLHALAKKPEERFASISAFARAFQQAAMSMPEATITKAASPQSPTPTPVLQTPSTPAPGSSPSPTPTPPPPSVPTRGKDLRATLAISQEEAQRGTTRTLTLPGGRRTSVAIPPGAHNGQTLYLEGQGEPPPTGNGEAGALIITIAVTAKEESKPLVDPEQAEAHTFFSMPPKSEARPLVSNITATKSAPQTQRPGFPRKTATILIGLAVLVVLGTFSAFYFTRTPTAPDPYPPSNGASAPLAVNDSLSGSTFTWVEQSLSQGSCEFTGGGYHVSAQNGSFTDCTNGTFNGTNFTYEVQMNIISGDQGGVLLRANSTTSNYYYFLIGSDKSYAFGLVQNNQLQSALKSGSNSAINTGQANQIAVVANGDNFDLYVNSQHIDSVSDNTLTSGGIGVMAYDTSGNGTEVAFNNAKVWTM